MKIKKIAQTPGLVATVVDNLTSTSTTDALSANQGRVLNDKIDNITNIKMAVLQFQRSGTGNIPIDYSSITGTIIASVFIGSVNTENNSYVTPSPNIGGIETQYNKVTGVYIHNSGGGITLVNILVFYTE